MLKELVISVSFLFALSGILFCLRILEKSTQHLKISVESVIELANENN